jgi:hypothetical protein
MFFVQSKMNLSVSFLVRDLIQVKMQEFVIVFFSGYNFQVESWYFIFSVHQSFE